MGTGTLLRRARRSPGFPLVAEPEVARTLRTIAARLDDERRQVEREHPSEVPALTVVGLASVLPAYSGWATTAVTDIP